MYLFSTLFLLTMLVWHVENVFEQVNLQIETTISVIIQKIISLKQSSGILLCAFCFLVV